MNIMTWETLEKKLKAIDDCIQPAYLIRIISMDEEGIALKVGETLSASYRSGDCIIFWAGGDSGVCNEEEELEIIKRIF